MPLYRNDVTGTLTYGTGEFSQYKILDNDIEKVATAAEISAGTTPVYISAFKIPVAQHERILFRAFLHFNYNASGDLKYKITTPGTTTKYLHYLRESEVPVDGNITETVTQAAAVGGLSEYTKTGATGSYYAWIQFGQIENGATAGDLHIQFSQNTSAADATILKAGSYLEYKKY